MLAATRGCIREAKNNVAAVGALAALHQSVISTCIFQQGKRVLLLKFPGENTMKVSLYPYTHAWVHVYFSVLGGEKGMNRE